MAPTNSDELAWYDGKPETLTGVIRKLEGALSRWRYVDAVSVRTFYAEPVDDWVPADTLGERPSDYSRSLRARQKQNLLRAAIESAASMIVQVPAIEVITMGGSDDQQRGARALSQFVGGVLYASDAEALAWDMFLDKCLTRVAACKVVVDSDARITVERIMPHTIYWNALEGRKPRNLFLRTPYPRAAARALWPDAKREIDDAPPYKPDEMFLGVDGVTAPTSDMIEIDEGYHTAAAKEKGRYVANVNGKILKDADYPHDFHVIIPARWSPSYASFAGSTAADTLLSYQESLDRIAAAIEEAEVKGAALRVLMPQGGETSEDELTNLQGSVIHHKPGMPPVFHAGAMLPPAFYAREEQMIQRAYAFMGVSYNVATGTKPAGVESGKGQREFRDIAAHRLVLHMKEQDRMFENIARTIIRVADHHYANKSAVVSAPGTKLLSRIDWKKDIDLKEDEYVVRCSSVNALSRHPAARIDEAIELSQAFGLSQKEGLRLANIKDTEALVDSLFSAHDLAAKQVSRALEGEFIAPEPYQGEDGLQMIVQEGQRRYTQELLEKEDNRSDYLDLLRRLIEQAKTTLASMQKPAAAPPLDAGAIPAAPMSPDALGLPQGPAGAPGAPPPGEPPMPAMPV